jgi:hypothetical protein
LAGKLEERKPLGIPRHRWNNNIKMDQTGMDWIDLAQDRDT